MNRTLTPPKLTPDEVQGIQEFWRVLDANRDRLDDHLESVARQIPAFRPIIDGMTDAMRQEQRRLTRERQVAAFENGDWGPLLEDLITQGHAYASMGIDFALWFDLVAGIHEALIDAILTLDPKRQRDALRGLNRYLSISMAHLGRAYLDAKEAIIEQQQAAIREVSTPVLQVQDGLLILPVVGVVDTHRARQLTEDLLRAIRDRRAVAVVIDITGVPLVDSKVANHLVQTVEAAGLMGATAYLTGISPEIAQTLVTIGANLHGVRTLTDLQEGIREAAGELAVRGRTVTSPVVVPTTTAAVAAAAAEAKELA